MTVEFPLQAMTHAQHQMRHKTASEIEVCSYACLASQVQDYHLMLLPKYLREHAPGLAIGWFLHTPFATSEMYRTLPHREEILRGVMGADPG